MDSIHNPMGGKGKREEGVEREKEVWVPLNTHIYIYIYTSSRVPGSRRISSSDVLVVYSFTRTPLILEML